jgi:hypothetical protein
VTADAFIATKPSTNHQVVTQLADQHHHHRAKDCTKGDHEWVVPVHRLSRSAAKPAVSTFRH